MMNIEEAAGMLLRWHTVRRELDFLESELKKFVLSNGQDVTAGNVHAVFNAPKHFKDYQLAVEETPRAMDLLKSEYMIPENVQPKIYKIICDRLGLTELPLKSTTEASVTFKIDKTETVGDPE